MPFVGEFAALAAAFLWGFGVLFFESAGTRIGAFQTNLLRIVLGTAMLSLTLYLQTGLFFPMHASQENYLWLGLSGAVGLAIGDGALFFAIVILGPRLSMLLLSLAPPVATIIAWFFLGESLELLAILGIVITIAAIVWVVSEKRGDDHIRGSKTVGVILGIVAALGQGVGVILAKLGLVGIDALPATLIRMTVAAVLLWGFAVVTRHAAPTIRSLKDKTAALLIFGGSIVGPFIGVWLSVVAVKYTEAGIAATLLSTVPVLLIPIEYAVHKRRPSLRGIIGTVLAVVGVALIFLR